jgi:hypothetical protein
VSYEHEDHVYAIAAGQAFRSTDGANSWTPVPGAGSEQLPPGLYLHSVVTAPGTVYVAATPGVFTSPDAGQHWLPFDDRLPNVEIKELLWNETALFAVTQGRGLWRRSMYEYVVVPPAGHIPDVAWWIGLYIAIYGGDPMAASIRQLIGQA